MLKINLKPWQSNHDGFADIFFRRAYFDDKNFVSEGDIAISESFGVWYVDMPFSMGFVNLEAKTAESLMFKLDLFLLEHEKYGIIEKLFIFPDNNL